jgi:hypothetical protein
MRLIIDNDLKGSTGRRFLKIVRKSVSAKTRKAGSFLILPTSMTSLQ